MDLSVTYSASMDALVVVLSGVMVVLGLVGVVVPVLPGLLLTWAGVAVWALATRGAVGWAVFAVATVVVVVGSVAKYLIPGRRLKESGVPWSTMAAGALLGVVGFFVVPVVGVLVGFVLGVYLAELGRQRSPAQAWPATRRALVLTGWSVLIELATGLFAAAVWVAGLLAA